MSRRPIATRLLQGRLALLTLMLGSLLCPALVHGLSAEAASLARIQRELTAKSSAPLQLADALELVRLEGLVAPDALLDVACQGLHAAQRRKDPLPLLRPLLAAVVRRAVREQRRPCPALAQELAGEVADGAWLWLGPFGAEHGSALAQDGVLEAALADANQAALPVPAGRDGPVGWQAVPAGLSDADGRVALDELVDRPDDALVYVQTELTSATEQPIALWFWTAGAARVWVEGKELPALSAPMAMTGLPDQPVPIPATAVRLVTLPAGKSRLTIKLAAGGASLGLRLALRTPAGQPALTVAAAKPSAGPWQPPSAIGTPEDAELLALALTGLRWPDEEAGEPPLPANAQSPIPALVALSWHDWPLPASMQERLLAAEPALLNDALQGTRQRPGLAADASAEVGMGFAHLAGEPGDRLDRVRWWRRDAADAPALQVEEVEALLEMGKASSAARLWTTLQADQSLVGQRVGACLLRVDLLRRLSLTKPAARLLDQCAERWPVVPALMAARAAQWEAADELQRAAAVRGSLATLLPGRYSTAASALQAALAAGEDAKADPLAAAWCQSWPARCRAPEALARRALARGDAASALRALDQLAAWLWRASSFELQGQALQQLGRTELAVRALREAERRAPGRPEVTARLALLTDTTVPWTPLRRDLIRTARELRTPSEPLALALRQTIVQALGNGRQDHYEAEIWTIGTGGPSEHEVRIEYAPSETRVEVLQAVVLREGEVLRTVKSSTHTLQGDDSGMYFEAEQLELSFSGLRPGDRVAVEWRLQDLHPTPFGLVFGELLALGDDVAIGERDIAVLLPEGTPLQSSLSLPVGPRWPAVQAVPEPTTVAGADGSRWKQWRWHSRGWPAVVTESSMPGATDVLPYLHVSTFTTWQAALQWYARLVAEALPTAGGDPIVRDLARKLTRDATTVEAKVRAIHAYAARQIRYVGLEFGIHSLKPHAVREIIDRKFGDCKDKATLLVALLREVGVQAQVVLVRTADLGGLHDRTASLGVFNHAIAYVPELDWWLDATAPHHEPGELPTGDHGATVLPVPRLDLAGSLAQAATAPLVLPAAQPAEQQEQMELVLQPQPSGDVLLTATLRWRGLFAAQARGLLQNASTRESKVQERLAEQFPGLAIRSLKVAGVEPPEPVVVLQVQGVVPKWLAPDGGRWRLAPLRPALPLSSRFAPEPRREQPLVLDYGWSEEAEVRLALPEGARLVSVPKGWSGSGPASEASLQVQPPGTSTATLRWRMRMPGRVEVKDVPALRRWLQQVDAALVDPLVLTFAPASPEIAP